MLHFRDHHWLLRHGGASCFNAFIDADDRKPEDVFWMLELEYVAGGAQWRRVGWTGRPNLHVMVNSFRLPGRKWSSLERLNYWEEESDEAWAGNDHPCGGMDAHYRPDGLGKPWKNSLSVGGIWRVAHRERGRFTVELAAYTDGHRFPDEAFQSTVRVLPDGTEERTERDAAFWKANSDIYLVEEVPFGIVTVSVPRNVADAEAYALARTRSLLGTPEPEHIEVRDFNKEGEEFKSYRSDLKVELHYHGYYES